MLSTNIFASHTNKASYTFLFIFCWEAFFTKYMLLSIDNVSLTLAWKIMCCFVISEGCHGIPESLSYRRADRCTARSGLPTRVHHWEHVRASPAHQAIQSSGFWTERTQATRDIRSDSRNHFIHITHIFAMFFTIIWTARVSMSMLVYSWTPVGLRCAHFSFCNY
jgi:hypothetical protein